MEKLRISSVPNGTIKSIQIIAKNKGISFSQLIKIKINEIIDQTPDDLKNPIEIQSRQITIYGISKKKIDILNSIAANQGIDLSALLKPQLNEIINSADGNLKLEQNQF